MRAIRACVCASAIGIAATGAFASVPTELVFRNLTVDDGLSQGTVSAIHQDAEGVMWFGTQDGLNRFDGYRFRVFKPVPNDPTSLPDPYVRALYQEDSGPLWVGTDRGLAKFDPSAGTFETFLPDASANVAAANTVRAIARSGRGGFWIGTESGVWHFNPATGRFFSPWAREGEAPSVLTTARVRAVREQRDGRLWVATRDVGVLSVDGEDVHHWGADATASGAASGEAGGAPRREPPADARGHALWIDEEHGHVWVGLFDAGLWRYSTEHDRWDEIRAGSESGLGDDRVRAIRRTADGVLWVATADGLAVRDPQASRFSNVRPSSVSREVLPDPNLTRLFQDRGGVLWIGTKNGGISRTDPTTSVFHHVTDGEPAGLGSKVVTAFASAPDGRVWIGTLGGGLHRWDRREGVIERYRASAERDAALADDRVMSLRYDSRGRLWIGTMRGGLDRLDRGATDFVHHVADPEDPSALATSGITVIFEARDRTIWVGTYGGGLHRYEEARGAFTRFRHDEADPSTLSSDVVTAIQEDRDGHLWIGTEGAGVNRLDPDTGDVVRFLHDASDAHSLSGNDVWAIHEDPSGALWIGTRGGGISILDSDDRATAVPRFRRLIEGRDLPNGNIYGILSDDDGKIWFSSNAGLGAFDPSSGQTRSFGSTYGVHREFNSGAFHRDALGRMFFGGPDGFYVFDPAAIRSDHRAPPVVLSAVYLGNRKLSEVAVAREGIDVGYRDYSVSFEFATLDYLDPAANRYAYRLDGFDQDWIDLGNDRRATYTNLPGGDYTLLVRAWSSQGVETSEAFGLDVRVTPPPWKTWWAYTLYILAVAGVGYAVVHAKNVKIAREAEYARRLEREVEARTRELSDKNVELHDANHRLREATFSDAMTGLRNRRYLSEWLDRRSPAQHDSTVFIMVDLDGLKQANDTFGHSAGDYVILQMSRLLTSLCRSSDHVVRWGGDEFLVVADRLDSEGARVLAERIRKGVASHDFRLDSGEIVPLSCSIGLARYPFADAPDRVSQEQVINIADRALYLAKSSGRNAWVSIESVGDGVPSDLVDRIQSDTRELFDERMIEVRSSIEPLDRILWN